MKVTETREGPAIVLLDRALELAAREEAERENWRYLLEQLDVRIRRNEEKISAEPQVPTVLQDEYRKEVDAVRLENMHLASRLEQTKSALERSKSAYKEESEYAAILQQKLEELEERLVSVIRRKTIN